MTVAVERVEKPDRSYKPGRQLIYNRRYQSELFAGPSIYSDRPGLRINKKPRVTKKEKERLQQKGEKIMEAGRAAGLCLAQSQWDCRAV